MALWKMPPKAKIYEALSAVGDGRVRVVDERRAEVESSSGTKTYTVEWSEDLSKITSNDNASFWQGYLGYPIIATLFLLGRLNFEKEVAQQLCDVPWKEINKRFRNDYDKAIDEVLNSLKEKGGSPQTVADEVDRIMTQVQELRLEKLPRRKTPPKDA